MCDEVVDNAISMKEQLKKVEEKSISKEKQDEILKKKNARKYDR